MKYRKKPVVIDAWQFDGSFESYRSISQALGSPDDFYFCEQIGDHEIEIHTLEGTMAARPGDWIIRGVKGELYPCKSDIFAATYDAVDSARVT